MKTLILKPKTRAEVADEYGIHARTLSRRLKKANIRLPNGLIMPCDLQIIYDTFGIPENLKVA